MAEQVVAWALPVQAVQQVQLSQVLPLGEMLLLLQQVEQVEHALVVM
jgi:hypothetical protein